MRRFFAHIRNAFAIRLQYTRREANGALVLICLCSAFISLPYVAKHYILSTTAWSPADELTFTLTKLDSAAKVETSNRYASSASLVAHLAKVNLNETTAEALTERGLPDWLAERVVKYRNHGGHFETLEELRKIYGMKPYHFEKVAPYLFVTSHKPAFRQKEDPVYKQTFTARPARKAQARLDINASDSATLVEIKGIGPWTASKIIKYRKLLGGYISARQLYDLYNQDSTRTAEFLPFIFVADGYKPTPFRINNLETDNLYHPYLPKTSVRIIKAYIRQHGPFVDVQDLVNARLLSATELDKLRPYLSLD